jgi:hypothetical protein
MKTSVAYLNHGRWVAECPEDWCTDAKGLYPQLPTTDGSTVYSDHPVYVQRCAEGHEFRIDAPPDDMRARIETALADRPPQFRDWLPSGHRWAANGYPTNQSPEDLVAEGESLKARLAAAQAAKRAEMHTVMADTDSVRDILAALGIEVRPDGTFSGSI